MIERGAEGERVLVNLIRCYSESDACKRVAMVKRELRYGSGVVRYTFQFRTGAENAFADACDFFGNGDTLKIRTFCECPVAESRKTVREENARQSVATVECGFAYFCYAVWNGERSRNLTAADM